MSRLNNQTRTYMVKYIEHLLKSGIYSFGNNLHMIANHLVDSGCRIHVSSRVLKYLNERDEK